MEPKNHPEIKIRKYHLNQTSMSLGSKCSFSRFFSAFLIVDSPPHKICHSKPDDETGSREKSSNDPEVLWLRKRRGAQRWVAHWLWGTDSQLRGFRFLRLAFLGGGLGYLFVVSPNLVSFVWGRNNFWYLKTISWYMVDATIFHIYVYTSFSCTTYSLRKCFFCFSNFPTKSQDDIWPPSRYAPADVRSWPRGRS